MIAKDFFRRLIKHMCVKPICQSDNAYYVQLCYDKWYVHKGNADFSCKIQLTTISVHKPIVGKQFLWNCWFFVNFSEIWTVSRLRHCQTQIFSQNYPLALLRSSAHAGSLGLSAYLIQALLLTIQHYTFRSSIHLLITFYNAWWALISYLTWVYTLQSPWKYLIRYIWLFCTATLPITFNFSR